MSSAPQVRHFFAHLEALSARMRALSKLDQTGKVTVSLGGSCKLRCRHCYITVTGFKFHPNVPAAQAAQELKSYPPGSFDTICISGDTDPLLRQPEFCNLLEMITEELDYSALMFTTRLLPSSCTIQSIKRVAGKNIRKRRLLIPCYSFVSSSEKNVIENSDLVPTTSARLQAMIQFREMGVPCLAAMRPIFPYHIVSRHEQEELINRLAEHCECILGEVLITDEAGELDHRLQTVGKGEVAEYSSLTFLDQPTLWHKTKFNAELRGAQALCRSLGIPFFIRSMSAVRLLQMSWDLDLACWRSDVVRDAVGCYDHLNP